LVLQFYGEVACKFLKGLEPFWTEAAGITTFWLLEVKREAGSIPCLHLHIIF